LTPHVADDHALWRRIVGRRKIGRSEQAPAGCGWNNPLHSKSVESQAAKVSETGPSAAQIFIAASRARETTSLKKELDPKWLLGNDGPRETLFCMLAATEKFAQSPNADALRMRHLRTERINRLLSRNRSSGLAGENELRANLERTRMDLAQR
jgi:hypothetical protein